MTTFVRLAKLTAPFHKRVTLAALLSFLTIAANVVLMATSAYLITKAALVTEAAALAIAVTSVRVLAIMRAGFRYVERLISHDLTFRILAHLRAWLYSSIEPLAPSRLTEYHSGDLLSRSIADIEMLENFYVRVIIPPIAAALVIAFACLILGWFDPSVALVLLLFLLLTGVLLPLVLRRVGKTAASSLISTRSDLSALLVDQVQGVADLIVFDRAGEHRSRVLAASSNLSRMQERLAVVRGLGSALSTLFAALAALSILAVAIPLVTTGALHGVYLMVLPLVALASFEAVQPLSFALQQYESSIAAGRRIFELIDTPPGVREPSHPAGVIPYFSIEFRDVTFRYHPGGAAALDCLSFTVPAGHRLGIVGSSGSGKSTIVNLLLRFWEYQAGRILIGSRDVRDYPTDTVRDLFGVVPQNVHLFNTTLRDNLLLANPDATETQIDAACRQALLDDFIGALPQGYETSIGEDGLLLSGGERQRLAVARMILRDAPIAILDEPTANLDTNTEKRLMQSLEPFLCQRTAIIISHRPSVLASTERIIELAEGRLISR